MIFSRSASDAGQVAMILLSSWCALRVGELTELRRHDVVPDPDAGTGVIRIERAAASNRSACAPLTNTHTRCTVDRAASTCGGT
jgi:hypothetical protein